MLWIYRFEKNRNVFEQGSTQKSQSEVRKIFSTISKPLSGRIKLQRQSETKIAHRNNDINMEHWCRWLTFLPATQKTPVRIRYVPPETIWCLRLEVRTSDFRSDNAGSIPAGITTSCFDPAAKMPDCLSGYTGSSPVGRAKWYLHLAVRIPDSQSGHAGSNPAGITTWSIGVMVTYLLAMQKLPVQVRYVPPEKWGIVATVSISVFQTEDTGSSPVYPTRISCTGYLQDTASDTYFIIILSKN